MWYSIYKFDYTSDYGILTVFMKASFIFLKFSSRYFASTMYISCIYNFYIRMAFSFLHSLLLYFSSFIFEIYITVNYHLSNINIIIKTNATITPMRHPNLFFCTYWDFNNSYVAFLPFSSALLIFFSILNIPSTYWLATSAML